MSAVRGVIHLSEALLPSKMAIPVPNPLFSPRPEVLRKLNEGLQGRLTTLIAGPGYGKSMHLAWFARQVNASVAWLQVDEYDGDPGRFLAYLREAVFPSRRESDPPSRPPSPEVVMAEIGVAARDRGSLLLVLDDLHAAPGPWAARFVVQLAEAAPPQLHLFIATRPSLRLPLGRSRALGEITEILQTDLTLSDPEASALVKQAAGGLLTPSQVKHATALGAGWGAGLLLLGATLRIEPAFNLAGPGIPEDLSLYLLEETWSGLSPDDQRLLECVHLVPHISEEVAAGLLGDADWGEALRRLHEVYGILHGTTAGEYRLHPLWDKFVRERMSRQEGQAGIQTRRREAAAVLVTHGRPFEAVHLYLAARAYPQAAALIAELSPVWTGSSDPVVLAKAVSDMPMQVLQQQPWLALWAAQTSFAHGRLDEARFQAEAAAEGFGRHQDATGWAVTAILQAWLAFMGGEAEAARQFLEDGFAAPASGTEWVRARLLEQRWLLHRSSQSLDLGAQEQTLREALVLYRQGQVPQPEHEARVMDRLGLVAIERGHLEQAIALLEGSVELLSQSGSPPWESGFNLGVAYSAACRFADALAIFIPMSQKSERPMRRLISALNLVDIHITLDDPASAGAAVRDALELAEYLKVPHLLARVRAELARLYRLQGEHHLAVTEAQAAVAQAAKGFDSSIEQDARRALAEARLWTQVGAAGAPDLENLAHGTPEWARTAALAGVYRLRSRTRSVREEGASLLRQALRALSQQSAFRGFLLRHWDLALTFAVTGLAAGVLPSVCHEILSILEEIPETARTRGIRLPEPEVRYLREAALALESRGVALLERLLHPDQRPKLDQAGSPLLQVCLLGRLSLRLSGKLLEGRHVRWRRTRALLLTLLLMPEGVEREVLIDWLWPDSSRKDGQNHLRVSLHNLRHLLEPDRPSDSPSSFVDSAAGRLVWIDDSTRADAWEVQYHLRTANRALKRRDPVAVARAYEQAAALYQAPLVTDGCSWLEGIRVHLHRQMVAALLWLADYHQTDRPEAAIHCLQGLLELEPGEEEAVRTLMILLARAGRQAEVAQIYRRCCDYLDHEFGVPVSPSTTAVFQDAVGGAGSVQRQMPS